MHGCEGTSLPKLLKLDFSRFGNLLWVEQLVDEIRHIGFPLQSHWIALIFGVGPFLDVGPDLVICQMLQDTCLPGLLGFGLSRCKRCLIISYSLPSLTKSARTHRFVRKALKRR